MKDWGYAEALGRGRQLRLKRFRKRVGGTRWGWYELGFKDGWEAREEHLKTVNEQNEVKGHGEEK